MTQKAKSSTRTPTRLRTTSAQNLNSTQGALSLPIANASALASRGGAISGGGVGAEAAGLPSSLPFASRRIPSAASALTVAAAAARNGSGANADGLPLESRSMGYDPIAQSSKHRFAHMESMLVNSGGAVDDAPPLTDAPPPPLPPPPPPPQQPPPSTSAVAAANEGATRSGLPSNVAKRVVHADNVKSTSSDSGIGADLDRSQSLKVGARATSLFSFEHASIRFETCRRSVESSISIWSRCLRPRPRASTWRPAFAFTTAARWCRAARRNR